MNKSEIKELSATEKQELFKIIAECAQRSGKYIAKECEKLNKILSDKEMGSDLDNCYFLLLGMLVGNIAKYINETQDKLGVHIHLKNNFSAYLKTVNDIFDLERKLNE